MLSQLKWGQKKLIKFEMKKGGSKKENKQQLRQGFPNCFERWRRELENFAWRNFEHSMILSYKVQ